MLTDIHRALLTHLSSMGIPCYLADCIPQGLPLPYLTADLRTPLRFGSEGTLALTCWCSADAGNQQRLNLADQLAVLLPSRGLCLDAATCMLVLTHAGGIQYITQHHARGIIFRFKLKLYPKA